MAGHQGDSTHHVLCRSHVEAWCWGWFIKLDHPSIFHGSFDGQRKLLKGAEENERELSVPYFSLQLPDWSNSTVEEKPPTDENLSYICFCIDAQWQIPVFLHRSCHFAPDITV
jgi:hypothetical protein